MTAMFQGELTVGTPGLTRMSEIDFRDHPVIIGEKCEGTEAMATRATWQLDGSGATNVDMSLYWIRDGKTIATSINARTPDEDLEYDGTLEPGEYTIRVRLSVGAAATYSLVGNITYGSPERV